MKRAQHCEIWPEHQEALDVFLACARQWRVVTGMAGAWYQGIDATALQATMQMMGVEDTRTRLEEVQHIEAGAVEKLN